MSFPESINTDRRARQRFPALRDGKPCLWLEVSGTRWPLKDLSLDGFSLPAGIPLETGEEFDFVLRLDDAFGKISGKACAVNEAGELKGCRFMSLQGQGADGLFEWLTVIVICNAKIRISQKEAEAIVKGPSLI